jgi:NTP pyrophosphatase (non-canonical NTP hydrolase)
MARRMMSAKVLVDVLMERVRQDDAHGAPRLRGYQNSEWLAVLVEEVGEVARAIQVGDMRNLREELVQVAAVAVAFVEALGEDG